jgi:hypothetical protein
VPPVVWQYKIYALNTPQAFNFFPGIPSILAKISHKKIQIARPFIKIWNNLAITVF